jgi:YVTN family beta-propeller protein
MEFRILGPVEVRRGDRVLRLGAGKQRALLALLLLHRNEAVTTERLVDDLWGDHPPETAAKIVQNYVSLLRRSFAEHDGESGEVILTHGHGYLLRLDQEALDLDQFEELLARGREALGAGDAEEASSLIHDALLLWRGPALADVAYEEFAQAEAARLEERRLVALECRIEADLALGRHADLVGELEALVARHPLQERFQAQLMLALYRSGRQAEALEAYQEARRKLVGELGIEPGRALRDLEQAILRQHASLAPPRSASLRARRRGRKLLALLVILALGVAAAVSVAILRDTGTGKPIVAVAAGLSVAPNSVAVIDPRTNAIVASIPAGAGPGPIAVGEGSVWVANVEAQTLTRIDASSRAVIATIGLGIEPTGLAVGEGAVWVAGGFDRALFRIDTGSNRIRLRLRVREVIGPLPPGYELGPSGVAVGEGGVWLSHGEEVSRIDEATGKVTATIPAGGSWTGAIAAGEGAVWVAENDLVKVRLREGEGATGIAKIDPASNTVVARIPIPGLRPPQTGGSLPPGALAAGEGALWAAAPAERLLWRIDSRDDRVLSSVKGGNEPASVAVGEGAIWVENHADQTVTRIDPFSNNLVTTIQIDRPTRGIAAGEGAIWVSVVS